MSFYCLRHECFSNLRANYKEIDVILKREFHSIWSNQNKGLWTEEICVPLTVMRPKHVMMWPLTPTLSTQGATWTHKPSEETLQKHWSLVTYFTLSIYKSFMLNRQLYSLPRFWNDWVETLTIILWQQFFVKYIWSVKSVLDMLHGPQKLSERLLMWVQGPPSFSATVTAEVQSCASSKSSGGALRMLTKICPILLQQGTLFKGKVASCVFGQAPTPTGR